MNRLFLTCILIVMAVLPAAAQQPLPPPRVAPRITFTVATTIDDKDVAVGDGVCAGEVSGLCSLRAAVQEGNFAGSAQIFLSAGTYAITLPVLFDEAAISDDLDITGSISISGSGRDLVTLDSNILDRVFHVQGGGALYLDNLTVSGGDPGWHGACILAQDALLVMDRVRITDCHNTGIAGGAVGLSNAWAEIRDSLFFGNSGSRSGALDAISDSTLLVERTAFIQNTADGILSVARGGAIFISESHLILRNSTLHGNQALLTDGRAGAIEISSSSAYRVLIENSTITNNSSSNRVGGILVVISPPTIRNSIIAGNVAAQTDTEDCARPSGTAPAIRSRGVNFIGTTVGCADATDSPQTLTGDPDLLPLGDYGGANGLNSMVPDADSPVLDVIDPADCPSIDQRAVSRPQNGACDLGAVERVSTRILNNGGFEPATPGGPCVLAPWKSVLASDKAVKDNPNSGECALRFKAVQGKAGKATFKVQLVPDVTSDGEAVYVTAMVRTNSATDAEFKVQAVFSNGAIFAETTILSDSGSLYEEVAINPIRIDVVRADGMHFTSVKIIVKNTGTSGKWYLDDVAVILSSDGTS